MNEMARLDCESTDSTYSSLSRFSGLSRAEILEKLETFSESGENEISGSDRWQALADWFRVPSDSFEVCWFHGTRTSSPQSFRNGILPRGQRLKGIWSDFADLMRDTLDPSQFARLKQKVETGQYGMGETGRDIIEALMQDQGPYAFLIKDIAVSPVNGSHNYVRVPEIVDLISSSFPEPHRAELKQRYHQKTKPCLVKFFSEETERQIVGCAADYLLHLHMGYPLECFLPWNFDGGGRQVAGRRILNAEYIPDKQT